MTTGAYISGGAHAALIAFLLFGGLFERSRLPEVAVADVSVISAEEFAALTAPEESPVVATDAALPEAPSEEEAPSVEAAEDADLAALEPPKPPEPEVSEAPQPAPEAPAPVPLPEAEVSDTLPPIEAPPVIDDRPEAPEEAAPAPAPRVAPEPAAPAPPEAEEAPVVVEETAPAPLPEEPQPEEVAAAPPEATTEIVTEAEETSLAPAASPRPRSRPQRPAAVAEAEPEAEPEPAPAEEASDDAVAAALAEALTGGSEPAEAPRPAGPPLSFGEKEALRVAVGGCWDVDVGGRSADVTVTVAVSMNPDGTVQGGQVRLVGASGGDDTAQRTAYEKARRAILRCQRGGYPLPVEKYDQWRDIEMTFNPEGMRLK